jgi:histone-lysine N-methyltransferase ASH1L
LLDSLLQEKNQDDIDKSNISMSVKEERGQSRNFAPDPRKSKVMSDSNDSDIEEVGRKMAPLAARHHRMDVGNKNGPGGTEDHSRILAPSFNWGHTANFTSTLDMDAIKVSHAAPVPAKIPTPLSTIAENWESSVGPPTLVMERTIPKLEAMDRDSSSDSESDGCSASESESGSNDGSSSSSCSSVESDSSSDNEEDGPKADHPRLTTKKSSSSHASGKHSAKLAGHSHATLSGSGLGHSTGDTKYSKSSPLQFPSQSCPSPQHNSTQSTNAQESSSKRHVSGSSHKSRKSSGSSKRMNSILLKKSSLLCQKSEYLNSPMETLSGSSPEREDAPIIDNLQEISQSKRDSNFAKSCKISEIYRSGLSNASSHKSTDKTHVKKKVNTSKPAPCDFNVCDDSQNDTKSREFESMPQLYDFSSEKPMPVLPANYTENHRTLSSMLVDAPPSELDLHSETKDNGGKDDTESDDSCMILETPERIGFNLFRKDYKVVDQSFSDDLKYKHKQNVISGIYGKSHDKSAQKKDSSFDEDMDTLDSSSSAPKLASEQSAVSDSDSIETSSSSCSEPYSPIPQEYPDVTESHQNINITQTTSFEDSCENSGADTTSSDDSTPPPLLEPQIPEYSRKKSSPISKSPVFKTKHKGRPKGSKNKKKVECGSQTIESAFDTFLSSSSQVHLVPTGSISTVTSPPMLIGFGTEASKLNRGRPRKNPPMLQPEIETNIEHREDDSFEKSDEVETTQTKKKKGKLSVLFAAAKHWQRQQEKKKMAEENIYEFREEASDKDKVLDESSESENSDPETCDIKHSKVVKSKFFKNRLKLKEYKKSNLPSSEVFHKHRISEKKRLQKHKKIIISSDEDDNKYDTFQSKEKKLRKVHKVKRTKKSVKLGDNCIQCQEVTMHCHKNQNPASEITIQENLTANVEEVFSDSSIAQQSPQTINDNLMESTIQTIDPDTDASCVMDDIAKPEIIKNEMKEPEPEKVYEPFSTVNNFETFGTFGKVSGLIFSKQYCTLKPDAFWKRSKKKVSTEERETVLKSETYQPGPKPDTQSSSTFTTKASLKEMPSNQGSSQTFPVDFVPRNQVQQMVSVLASAKCSHSKSSKKRKEKEDKKAYHEVRNKLAYETTYETQSEDEEFGINRRKKKGWKSKHKNVIDPVFLGELEHLIQDIACCQLEIKLSTDFWPDRPSDSVPSIFRRRKIFTSRRKKDLSKITKRAKIPKQTIDDSNVTTLDISENDEQRLPLKKRHHHLQGDGKQVLNTSFEEAEIETVITSPCTLQIKSPEKICREFRNTSKVRQDDFQSTSSDIRLSPSKIPLGDKRTLTNAGLKMLQEKLIKKPTAADRIVEKLGIQIKKESVNSANNETKSERNGKAPERAMRRISKELDFTGDKSSVSGNTSKELRGNLKMSKEISKMPCLQIKHESKLKATPVESTFVDNIQDCIEKYTNASTMERPKLKQSYGPVQSYKEQETLTNKYQQKKNSSRNMETFERCYSSRQNYVPIFSSPEPDIAVVSGRESSLSQSSTSSDACSVINIDAGTNDHSGPSSQKSGTKVGRSSRQDLHNHLWRQDKSKCETKSNLQRSNAAQINVEKDPIIASFRSLSSGGKSTQDHLHLPPSKPLPTEPIRRVDLGPLSYCNKPLNKVPRFLGGQEFLIRKVPQAIVAPFRRNPPETTPVNQVVPIHRASISLSAPTPIVTTSLNTISSLTSSTTTSTSSPTSVTSTIPTTSITSTNKQSPNNMPEHNNENSRSIIPSALETRNRQKEQKTLEKTSGNKDGKASAKITTMGQSSSSSIDNDPNISPPKTRAKLDQQAKIESLEKKAKIKKCQVAVERLRQEISRSALLTLTNGQKSNADDDKRRSTLVENCLTEIADSREGNVKDSNTNKNIVNPDKNTKDNKCSTKKLENMISEKEGPLLSGGVGNNPTQETRLPEKNLTQGGHSSSGSSAEQNKIKSIGIKIKSKSHETENETQQIEDEKLKSKKRRRKTNKTGFPNKSKKKKKTSSNDEEIDQEKLVQVEKLLISTLPVTSPTPLTSVEKAQDDLISLNSEISKDSLSNIDIETTKQTVTGRPVRECRLQEEKSLDNEIISEPPTTNLERGKKRLVESLRGRGRPPKRLKIKSSHSPFSRSNSSSIDPSPASSDVESIDYRSYLDEESDGDSLTILPSSEDNFLSPSIAESSEVHSEEKRKRSKPGNVLKKNFLKAGLFSYDFKNTKNSKRGPESLMKSKGMMYKPEEHPFSLLPPPYYCGRQLRQKKEDFALPYDLWHLHSTNMLPTRDIIATWNYKRIKNNVYYDVKPVASFETPACHCKFPEDPNQAGCADKCLNRMTYTECDPSSCRLGDRCSNMNIQKHLSSAVVQRFMTTAKGWGVKTKSNIPAGTFIMEYLGEVVTDKEFKRRMHTDYQQDSHHYCLHVGEGLVIDGHRMGGECRFVNHSCKPNCEMQKWSVNGSWRMALFSRGPIPANEELTYDYNFSLFNPHEGQTCHCGNEECRGVIGGKGRKNLQKTPSKNPKTKDKTLKSEEIKKEAKTSKQSDIVEQIKTKSDEQIDKPNLNHFVPLKPMTVVQQQFCRTHSVLLLRNLEKIRKLRDLFLNRGNFAASQQKPKRPEELNIRYTEEVFKTGLTALTTARSVQTRRLAIAQDNPDVSKVVQIAKTFQEILESLKGIRTENGENMINNFVSLPSKEDLPQYHLKISEPIDFSSIEKSLSSGSYNSVAHIDQDILLLFQNNIRFYGNSNRLGEYANVLRKKYMELCMEHYDNISEIVGLEGVRCLMRPNIAKTDDIIQCPCGQFKDEGVMVQCDECSSWQHIDCIKADEVDPSELDKFICDTCSKVKPKLDIALVPQPEFACPGETYFVSMEREDGLHVTLGMTVYVLRAFKDSEKLTSISKNSPSEATDGQNSAAVSTPGKITVGPGGVPHKSISPIKGPSKEAASLLSGNYPTYKTVDKNISADDMDIFRVERLWINEVGKMFAFGYHYLRPHETFHEPTRRFFDNEVFRVPLYEVLPLDTIWRQCWVMDPPSFCRGRPNSAEEQHVYICEYRVDKTARLFNKISKPKYPVCTKFYAFNDFDLRLKVTRAYTPHEVPGKWSKTNTRGRDFSKVSRESSQGSRDTPEGSRDASVESNQESAKPAGVKKTKQKKFSQAREAQKPRRAVPIDQILNRLLDKTKEGDPQDISYLLEGMKRKRNRTNYHEGN